MSCFGNSKAAANSTRRTRRRWKRLASRPLKAEGQGRRLAMRKVGRGVVKQQNNKRSAHAQGGKADDGCNDSPSHGYRAEYASQAETLCHLGFDEDELASFFIVDRRTIEDWKRSRPEFGAAVESGKCAVDGAVQVYTLKRILGYHHYVPIVSKGKKVYHSKYVPPDADAGLRWLSVRRPEEWGGKPDAKYRSSAVN